MQYDEEGSDSPLGSTGTRTRKRPTEKSTASGSAVRRLCSSIPSMSTRIARGPSIVNYVAWRLVPCEAR